jgi:hypothetical protein
LNIYGLRSARPSQRVNINDDMAEKLTPPDTLDAPERREILSDLAKALKKQGSFTLASKKYTQVLRLYYDYTTTILLLLYCYITILLYYY